MCSLVTAMHKIILHFARCPVVWSGAFLILWERKEIVRLPDIYIPHKWHLWYWRNVKINVNDTSTYAFFFCVWYLIDRLQLAMSKVCLCVCVHVCVNLQRVSVVPRGRRAAYFIISRTQHKKARSPLLFFCLFSNSANTEWFPSFLLLPLSGVCLCYKSKKKYCGFLQIYLSFIEVTCHMLFTMPLDWSPFKISFWTSLEKERFSVLNRCDKCDLCDDKCPTAFSILVNAKSSVASLAAPLSTLCLPTHIWP